LNAILYFQLISRVSSVVMNVAGPSPNGADTGAEPGPDRRYFTEAIRWENKVIRLVNRSRTIAWIIAAISGGLAGMAMTCLVLLLTLKSFEPYVIEVDKTPGFLEIKQPLADGDLTQNEAITRMKVVRLLKARETYDPTSVKEKFDLAQLLSTGDAARDLLALIAPRTLKIPSPGLAAAAGTSLTQNRAVSVRLLSACSGASSSGTATWPRRNASLVVRRTAIGIRGKRHVDTRYPGPNSRRKPADPQPLAQCRA
jgi:hypothetical protein